MEVTQFSRSNEAGYLMEKYESHWQPALRPDNNESQEEDHSTAPVSEQQAITQEHGAIQTTETTDASQATNHLNQSHIDAKDSGQSLMEDHDVEQRDLARILSQGDRSASFPAPNPDVSQHSGEHTDEESWMPDSLNSDMDNAPAIGGLTDEVDGPNDLNGAKFDEGIPLLNTDNTPQELDQNQNRNPKEANAFELALGDDEGFFSSQLDSNVAASSEPLPPERKSTEDVLSAMHFASKEVTEQDDFFSKLGDASPKQQNPTQLIEQDKWAAAFGGEDEFLIEEDDDFLPDSNPASPSSFIASLQQEQDNVSQMNLNSSSQPTALPPSASLYAPHQPSVSSMASFSSSQLPLNAAGNLGLGTSRAGPMQPFQMQSQNPPQIRQTESFADQSKGGYKSPYDLPLDISKSKRKVQLSRAVSQPQTTGLPPPPRSSSMSSDKQQVQLPLNPASTAPSGGNNTATMPSPSPGVGGTSGPLKSAPSRQSSSSSFFEDLPITSRPRPNPARSIAAQERSRSAQPLPGSSSPPKQRITSAPAQPLGQANDQYGQFQLRPPERLDPFANVGQQVPQIPPTASTSRYSPAPGSAFNAPKPTPSPRYSPAPPSQVAAAPGRYASQPAGIQAPPISNTAPNRYVSQPSSGPPPSVSPALSFQPRTSSPLAHQHTASVEQSKLMPPPPLPAAASNSALSRPSSPPASMAPPPLPTAAVVPPPLMSPPQHFGPTDQPQFTPPKRSQTQSPSRHIRGGPAAVISAQTSQDRPASAYGNMSPTKVSAPYTPAPAITNAHSKAEEIVFVRPTDESSMDPLERWKGAPIFNLGFGGQVVSSFPSRTPRYGTGMLKPQIKAGAGEVKISNTAEALRIDSKASVFPGPLRGKSKKKDVLSWLTTSIASLEAESPTFLGLAQTLPDPRKRHEEKILLWKIIKVLVEFDGHFDTNPEALKSVNVILTPEVHAIDESTASQYSTEPQSSGIYRPAGALARTESADPVAVEALRKHLLKGNRQDAVWHAVDNRLWSHALLLSSTLEQKVWKQVVQEFVRQEVKTVGDNAESLAALYEIFGGNVEDSVDQLVPPSARAGLQMVSKVDSIGPTKNALDGLDKWKETLALVLNNRTKDDYSALATLARLLGDYGRVEAAHICLLFARNPAFPVILGGFDDAQANIILLGADHRAQPAEIHLNEDALLLTEVYEFATCTLAGSSAATPLPYLAPYKLYRAKTLADNGFKAEAQAYCEAIAAGLKATSKVSPYYHPLLLTELDELSNRLKQIPIQSSSWMSKPSIEKVSGSLFSKFTNFVAGEDSDAASQGSGKDASGADIGPFAGVSGSPNMSRSGSQTDLYGTYTNTTSATTTAAMTSRYAPNGIPSARSSSEFGRGRASLDYQRSPPATSHGHESRPSIYSPLGYQSQNQSPARSVSAYQPLGTSPSHQYGSSPSYSNYQATPPQTSYMPSAAQHPSTIREEQQSDAYMPTPPPEEKSAYISSVPLPLEQQSKSGQQPAFGGYLPSQNNFIQQDQLTSNATNPDIAETQAYGYEPPSDSGYVPYQPEPDSDDDAQTKKPKKKSFMDDDDDNFTHGSQPPRDVAQSASDSGDAARRKANDEAADAAFRAAAEADAQRAKEQTAAKRSSGWFGGWLGGSGKKPDASLDSKASGSDQKVYKAKLGENKMKLYYDKDLKKWVNPDDPDSAKTKSATPPPPRIGGMSAPPMGGAPPPRAGGSSAPPPNLSRSSTPASTAGVVQPGQTDGIASILPPSVNTSLGLSNGSTPPPSAGGPTPVSAASATTPLSGRSASAGNSIDDLLAPMAGARKGPRGGKKAKGGRYVDIMAK